MMARSDETALRQSLAGDLKVLRERLGVTALELSPRKGSALYFTKNHFSRPAPVKIACDNVIAVDVLTQHGWELEEIKFAELVLGHGKPVTLVDVGANAGLFSRQMLASIRNIEYVFAYEPDPANFDLLSFNLAPFEKVECINAALSESDGKRELFLDPENCGNYSLLRAAMPAEFSSVTVEVKSAFGESRRWLENSAMIFYKSDTQGFDEFIATQFDMPFWDRVVGGILELWRIEKPAFDAAKLQGLLDSFPNKVFLHDPAQGLSTADVLEYLRGRDYHYENLAFWR